MAGLSVAAASTELNHDSAGWPPWVSPLIAGLALFVSVAALVRASWKDRREAVWSYLQMLISAETVAARSKVGVAARSQGPIIPVGHEGESRYLSSLDQERLTDYRDAILRIMWIIPLSRPIVIRHVRGKDVATHEATKVYAHLNLMVPDLIRALRKWGHYFDWYETGERTNEVLRELPAVKNGFMRTKTILGNFRLPVELALGDGLGIVSNGVGRESGSRPRVGAGLTVKLVGKFRMVRNNKKSSGLWRGDSGLEKCKSEKRTLESIVSLASC